MLTVNPRLNSLPGWELDSYGYGGNHAFPTDQIDTQNPFISPILPPSTKTFACTPPANPFSPSFDETTVGVDITSSAQPVQVSPNASAPSPATTSTPMTSAGSPSQSPPPPSPKPKPKSAPKNHDRKRSPNHIKRPSNAFLIYRTHLVKSEEGEKIKKVEKNQQILSKFVGEKWRRLSEEDKAKWVAKAKEAQEQHALKHPNYSYQPAKREQIKRRRQRKTAEQKEEDKVNLLNRFSPETMKQPIVESTAPRKRKSRAKKKTVEPQQQEQQEQEPAVLLTSSTSLKAPVQGDSQPVISKPITANDILASAAPVVSESTAANELQARFSRDKAAGMPTTTDMYNAQYTYTSFFAAPQQSQFLPSSQVQVEYHGSSIVPNDLFKGDVFQSLLLPPGAAGSSAQNWGAEGSAVSAGSGSDFVNICHMSSKPIDFPIQMYSQPENQHSDMRLAEPKFVSSADLSQINLNLDGFDFSFFYGSEGATAGGTQAVTPADIIQFASNEGLSGIYGFTNTNGGENLDAGVQPVGSVMSQSQEAGTGTLVHGNSNVVGAHMNANHANLGITVGSEAEKKKHDDATSGVSSQYFGTVNPSEISISQSGLGIYPYQQLDGNATVQAESGVIIKEPRFFDFSKGNLEVASTTHVDPATLTQENGYGSKGIVYTNQPTYYPAAVVVQPENQHPDMYTNFMVDDYGALNDNDINNVLVSHTNVHPSATAGHPIIVQAEDHHHQAIIMNHLADPQIQSYSAPPSHSYLEMSDGYGMMHCSDPTLAGVFVPDKPPPYLYLRALDVPTNAIANGNGYKHGHGHGHGHGYGY